MTFKIGRLGHIGIHVSNVERSVAFYREVVGLKLTGNWKPPESRFPICFMRLHDKHHDVVLFELPEDADRSRVGPNDSIKRRDVGLHHIAFEFDSREEWLHAIDHLRSRGIELVDGPLVHGPESTGPQNFRGGSGSHAVYFLDPDGNRIEFYCWMMTVSRSSLAAPTPDL